MTVKYKFGKSIPRFEDARYLTGQASYTSDIKVPNMVFARMLRSHYPAGRIAKLDVSAAKEAEGVITKISKKGKFVDSASTGDEIEVITNQTPFYGESGGQIGDAGPFQALCQIQTELSKRIGGIGQH